MINPKDALKALAEAKELVEEALLNTHHHNEAARDALHRALVKIDQAKEMLR